MAGRAGAIRARLPMPFEPEGMPFEPEGRPPASGYRRLAGNPPALIAIPERVRCRRLDGLLPLRESIRRGPLPGWARSDPS